MTPMIQGSKVNTVRITGSSWIMCGQLLEPRCRQISYNEVNFAFACVLTPFTPQNIPKPTTIISIINHSHSKGFSKCATIVSPSHWLAQLTRKSPEKSLVAWGDAAGVGVPDAFQELWKPDGFWDRRIG